ncbi:MAG: UDP-N-acetylmuramoyl-tripeptide--D-alanyl-D-alanine ligase [Oscillospiraceae bacterium]|nr:UDP-N-acetylmuramoyl-tripeptide--D-alanyl-D-alanine ligase [Candidatus Ruminococcus equi]
MKPITLKEIANACSGKLVGDENTVITSVETDSRKVVSGTLFAAIPGNRVDGHDFIESSIEKGMACALCEREPNCNTPYILVPSTLQALKDIAAYYRSLFTIPIIGITGSVGKTSTKEMIASVLSVKYKIHKTEKNFNSQIGVPLTVFGIEEDTEISIIEMGISDFGEMSNLAKIVKPDICVFTNIGDCHLEALKDRDGVFRAKTEMLDFVKPQTKVFYNANDKQLWKIKDFANITPVPFGFDISDKYYATNVQTVQGKGVLATLVLDNEKVDVTIPAIGEFMVLNALCAAGIGKQFNMTNEEIKKGIESFENVGSRSRVIDTGFIMLIDDCYNANPTSVKASINSLSKFMSRKVAVIGDMKELGENENDLHKQVAEYILSKGIDLLICAGKLCENMAKVSNTVVHFDTTEDCAENISKYIEKGDTVLVKASHSMHFEKIVEKLKEL